MSQMVGIFLQIPLTISGTAFTSPQSVANSNLHFIFTKTETISIAKEMSKF